MLLGNHGIMPLLLHPILATGRGDAMNMQTFLEAVMAGITAYYVCKWLDVLLSFLE